jgi:hypothetical protein
MFNEDWAHFFTTRHAAGIDVGEKELREFILQYKGTDVTDFAMNVNAKVASFPSKVLENYGDKYLKKTENGVPVDFSDTWAKTYYDIFVKKNLDMYRIWIDILREIGIKPWLSVRTNDIHDTFAQKPNLRRSEYVLDHPHFFRVRHRNEGYYDYYDGCLDFEIGEVRNQMLAFIREVLDRYDADGLELDFTREIYCFQIGHEERGARIMAEFMRSVKAAVTEAEGKRGHKILIHVLAYADPLTNLNAGTDVIGWAKEGFIDSVAALPRWDTTDTDIPVAHWKQILPGGVKIGGGLQVLVKPYPGYNFGGYDLWGFKDIWTTDEVAYGQMAAILSGGADFVYLYNFMDNPEHSDSREHSIQNMKTLGEILRSGTLEKLRRKKRRHPVTYKDTALYWQVRRWQDANAVLPKKLNPHCQFLRLNTGEIPADKKAYLVLGLKSETAIRAEDLIVYANSVPCGIDAAAHGFDKTLCSLPSVAFEIPGEANLGNYIVAEVAANGDCELHYAEVVVEGDS